MSLYEHVRVVAPGLTLDRQRALVAVARSRGVRTDVDAELRAARDRVGELEADVPSTESARRRVAEAERDLTTQRERVATLRGRVLESDDPEAEAAYRTAIAELAELETERVAAGEALESARRRARAGRDVLERRMRLEDRVRNLERRARAAAREAVRPVVDAAVAETPGSDAASYADADDVTAALALVRAGRIRRPVVLACRRFPDAASAEAWLGTPVVRL